ncbi:hypothetical protein [Dactylosporangium sp. NPDC049140]|uniref:hypothetical protein n=1 Tax=Dactylosporangium sp. NPDC049140 TaxID=3155647 RepID=UPI0033DA792E
MSNFEIGRVEATNVQFGDHGLMIVNQQGDSALVAAIRRERGRVADPAAAERAAIALQAELAAPKPDAAKVRDLIDRVSATAGTAPEVAAELATVRRLVNERR